MKLYIRPVWEDNNGRERLLSYALCRTDGRLLVDQQIVEHFTLDYSGKEITAAAKEFHGATEVVWGDPISIDRYGCQRPLRMPREDYMDHEPQCPASFLGDDGPDTVGVQTDAAW